MTVYLISQFRHRFISELLNLCCSLHGLVDYAMLSLCIDVSKQISKTGLLLYMHGYIHSYSSLICTKEKVHALLGFTHGSHVVVLLIFTEPPLVCSQVRIVASHELCFLVASCSTHVCLAFCRGTKVSELRAMACMRRAPCVPACGWEPGRLLSSGP